MFKKSLIKIVVFVGLFLGVFTAFSVNAGEGHDHDHDHGSSSMMPAQKGGVVKAYDEGFLEMVAKGKTIKVYFFNKDFTPMDLKTTKVSAKAIFPRKKGEESLKGAVKDNVFEADYENAKFHRYELEMKFELQGHGHPDTLHFTVEKK